MDDNEKKELERWKKVSQQYKELYDEASKMAGMTCLKLDIARDFILKVIPKLVASKDPEVASIILEFEESINKIS